MRPLSPRRPFTGRGGTRHLATRLFILYGLLLESAHLLRAGNDTVPELGALPSAVQFSPRSVSVSVSIIVNKTGRRT